MNLTMYECINNYCTYVTRDINLFKEFLPLTLFVIAFATILILIELRYRHLKKKRK